MTNRDFRKVERDLHALLRATAGADRVCRNYERGMITLEEVVLEVFRLEAEQRTESRG